MQNLLTQAIEIASLTGLVYIAAMFVLSGFTKLGRVEPTLAGNAPQTASIPAPPAVEKLVASPKGKTAAKAIAPAAVTLLKSIAPTPDQDDLTSYEELFHQANQITSADYQNAALADAAELPELVTLFHQSAQVGAAHHHSLALEMAETALPLATTATTNPHQTHAVPGEFDGLSCEQLVALAKATRFPSANKWAKTKKLGAKIRAELIQFLIAQSAAAPQ